MSLANQRLRLLRQQTKHVLVFSKATVNALGLCADRTVRSTSRCVVYFACLSGRSFLSPGEMSIEDCDLDDGSFAFFSVMWYLMAITAFMRDHLVSLSSPSHDHFSLF